MRLLLSGLAVLALAFVSRVGCQIPPEDFDLDTHPAYAMVIPRVEVAFRKSWNPAASDVTMIVRAAVMVITSWFDALAPYTTKTKGK